MSISGVTSARQSVVSGLLQTITALPTAGSQQRDSDKQAGFGPAFLFGGSQDDVVKGLYSALGSLLSASRSGSTPAIPGVQSPADKERTETLKSAAAAIDRGDTEAGRQQVEKLLDENAGDVKALRLTAYSYLKEQNYKEAERHFLRASALDPGNARIKSELADARILQESDDEVLAAARRKIQSPAQRLDGLRLLMRLSERSPESADIYVALADGHRAAGKPLYVAGALHEALRYAGKQEVSAVISRAEQLVREHPGVGLPHNILGRALHEAGRLSEAIGELEAATTVAPYNFGYRKDLVDGYVARAVASLESGDAVASKLDLHAAQRLDPSHSGLSEAYARLAAAQAEDDITGGRYSSALTELRKAALKAPQDEDFRKAVASLYVRVAAHFEAQNGDAVALSAYIQAYELDATSTVAGRKVGELGHEQGLSYLDAKDYDEAITHLDRAYQADRSVDLYRTDLARAYDLRGRYHETLGELDEAIEDYKSGLALDPTNASLTTDYSTAVVQQA